MTKGFLEPSNDNLKKMMVKRTASAKQCPDPCSCQACHCGGKCSCDKRSIRRK
jgi:hypothetical protein